uniref:aECM cysteine-cradle domain-containing protein n=1 Tax=Globodera rostochiensis TaxID=31243 RepID=A0A914I9I9_GLORO
MAMILLPKFLTIFSIILQLTSSTPKFGDSLNDVTPKEKANGGILKGKMTKRYCRLRCVEEYLGFDGNEANAQRSTSIELEPPLAAAFVPQERKEKAIATPRRPIRSPIRKVPTRGFSMKPPPLLRIIKLDQNIRKENLMKEIRIKYDERRREGEAGKGQNIHKNWLRSAAGEAAPATAIKATLAARVKLTNSLMYSPTTTGLPSSATTTSSSLLVYERRNRTEDGMRPAVVYSTKAATMAQNANSASMLKAFAPVSIAEESLQMTQQNCRKMESYATMFGVSDPRGWVRSNCFFLQMYVHASCEDISTFVSSCSNYEQKETNKGGNK